ncbi:Eco57I restriction-modification methylase domain-containing protein [Variovorax guangxiensis]|uniref:Eco57I restriction-modification methylase domain-containing protein n=1 Tax=Variovorax guangxiensis TaxID=1775474 RepID=UPI0028671808|nr:N-6 DNA methylase [Variovorax guangxiensis]MDR6855303.1 hypothetical protein [Variovorax guangxiensis]
MPVDTIAKAFSDIEKKRRRPWQGEEEVRLAWVAALEAATGFHFDAERARKDSSYNHVVIEFKAPAFFKGSKASAKFKEATEKRLLPYIQREAKKAAIDEEDFIGIAIDGEHICFAQVRGGAIHTQHLIPFSEYAVSLVIHAIQADTLRAVTAPNLLNDFGHGSKTARALMQAMADALSAELAISGNTKIKMLFEEWKALYGQVADMSILQAEAINAEMGFSWKGAKDQAMSGRLFVIHTYNSLLIKLLAAEIVSAHGLTASTAPAQVMSAMKDDVGLLDALHGDIERADLFASAGIKGFVEEAIFGWYIDVARKPAYASILPALREVLATLSLYRTDKLTRTRDVLRDVYQGLVPGKLRQSLGEFYTPDWLVDLTIEKAKRGSWLDKRALDPTCGSGAFLLSLLRLIRAEAKAAKWKPAQIVQHLTNSVWGFDLNPLAVQTARVNFLMEIADLLRASPGQEIEIPVMLADAIYSPAASPKGGESVVHYKIGSQIAGLDIQLPSALAFDRVRLDDVFAHMCGEVENEAAFAEVEGRLVKTGLIKSDEVEGWREPLKHTYDQILDLHRQQWNGIWFRVVRNFFWSATAGHFDVVVGNPPWVRWSKLPELYRERVKPTCEHYGIFSATKYHGGNELDISAMITYTTADKWLKTGGAMAFVITGTLFKNPSSAGFRGFKIVPSDPSSAHLSPVSVDDLKTLKPFEDAANHTAIAVFNKTAKAGKYPIPYRLWNNTPGSSRSIPATLSLPDVLARVQIGAQEAVPVGAAGSPWAVLEKGRYKVLRPLAGECTWTAGRKGITADLNGVYFVPIVQDNGVLVQIKSRPDAGKKDIGPVKTSWVEPDLLYPLVKGAGDFEACYLRLNDPKRAEPLLYTFVPNEGISGQQYDASAAALNRPELAKTKRWFQSYKKVLEARSTYRRQMENAGAPYHAVYNVGDYTFQKWKVIWPEMSTRFYAAVAGSADVPVVGSRPFVPDHKIYFAAFDEEAPAHFLCGLLNASMVREWVESHNVSIQMGDVFKHMTLPEFDAGNPAHVKLASLVAKAHSEHDPDKRAVHVKSAGLGADAILLPWMKGRMASPKPAVAARKSAAPKAKSAVP